jgi:hypothetical protein
MKYIAINLFLFLVFISSTCNKKDIHYEIKIRNLSNESIAASWTDSYPDTVILCPLGYALIKVSQDCAINLTYGWENEFERIDTFQIFILDTMVINTIPCDTIKKYNYILKRYQLSYDDLQRMNWVVPYP